MMDTTKFNFFCHDRTFFFFVDGNEFLANHKFMNFIKTKNTLMVGGYLFNKVYGVVIEISLNFVEN